MLIFSIHLCRFGLLFSVNIMLMGLTYHQIPCFIWCVASLWVFLECCSLNFNILNERWSISLISVDSCKSGVVWSLHSLIWTENLLGKFILHQCLILFCIKFTAFDRNFLRKFGLIWSWPKSKLCYWFMWGKENPLHALGREFLVLVQELTTRMSAFIC